MNVTLLLHCIQMHPNRRWKF